jgi:hypothetical protein
VAGFALKRIVIDADLIAEVGREFDLPCRHSAPCTEVAS